MKIGFRDEFVGKDGSCGAKVDFEDVGPSA